MIKYKGSMFLKLFITYFILFTTICIMFSLVLLRQVEKKNQAVRQQEYANQAELLARILDERFTDIDKIGSQIIGMDWAKRIRSQSEIITKNIDVLKRQEICHQMGAYQSIIRMSKSTALLLPQKELVVDSVSFWDMDNYLTSIGLKGLDIDTLLLSLPVSMTSLTLSKPDYLDNDHFFVMKQLNYASTPELVLFLYMDGRALSNLLNDSYEDKLCRLEIRDQDQVLFSNTWKVVDPGALYSRTVPSSLFAWEYHFDIGMGQAIHSMTVTLTVIIILAGLILGTAIAYLLARMSYSPIAETLNRLGVESGKNSSELAAIEHVFLSLRKEKQSFERLSQQYFGMAKNNLLIILLNGLFDESVTQDLLHDYGLNISDQQYYMVVLFQYQDDAQQEKRPLHYVKLQEILPKELGAGYFVELADQRLALIANFPRDNQSEFTQNKEAILAAANNISGGQLDTYFGLGDRGVIGISKSYQDAKEQASGITGTAVSYYYPGDWKNQLIGSLREGKRTVARRILIELMHENRRRDISFQEAETLVGLIQGDILSTADPFVQQELLLEFCHASPPQDTELLWEHLFTVLEKVCPASVRVDSSTEIGAQIAAYVDTNVYDLNLSQQSIAAEFGVSRPMVSKLFKRAVGINFIDYIHKHRIDRAKSLFHSGHTNVLEVAQEVGYDNEITFKRAFMRVEAITPRKYLHEIATQIVDRGENSS